MSKLMLIDAAHPEETRVAIVNNGQVDDFDFETTGSEQLRGNIYLAKVTRVEPSLQAAFVEYGGNRHGFLAFSEIHPDYYQLPAEDREALLREAAEEAAAAIDDEDDDDTSENGDDEADESSASDESDSDDEEEDDSESNGEAKSEKARKPKKSSRTSISKRYKIQEVIRRRQVMLVQVVKEERGNKGAALTTYLSLAGRYSVLMPNTPRGGGISRKIVNGADRRRLKSIVAELDVPDGMGLIVRTAGAKRTKAEIKRDYDYLSKLWETIVEKTLSSEAPMLINAEGGLVHRAMRDMFDKEIEEVLVQGEDAYREAKDLAKLIMPSQAKKVQHWKDEDPIFVAEAVEQQLDSIYSPVVQLKSGGYLVINQTEALVAIDVNSGKSTRERNIEQTALRTNLEAAEEACRQMRLRDLAGLIVIDFIDMDENKNNRAVEKKLKEHLKVDRARVQHGRISQFGLMEISRQRRRQGVLQATSDPCEACNGTGRRRSIPSAALQLIRAIEARASMGGLKAISVKAPTDVALYLLNNKREALVEVERMAGFAVSIHSSEDMLPGDFVIDAERDPNGKPKKRKPPRSLAKPSKQEVTEDEADEDEEDTTADSSEQEEENTGGRRKRRRRRGGRGRKSESAETSDEQSAEDSEDDDSNDDEADTSSESDTNEDGSPRKRRRRGRRGGRRRRKSNENRIDTGDEAPTDGGAYLDGLSASAAEMLDDVPASEVKAAEEAEAAKAAEAERAAKAEADAAKAEAKAEESDAKAEAQDDAKSDETSSEEKPKRARRSRKKPTKAEAEEAPAAAEKMPSKEDKAPELESEKIEPADEPAEAPVAEKAEPAPAPEPEAKPEPEPAAEPETVDAEPVMAEAAETKPAESAEPEKKDTRPKRTGWWARAKRD
ncbi:Rne/Rng family ribonuclease [Hyphomonas pacifica]|uniref:Rne/Rng family ribonuclease n=1 Tax=Hyphomonas pacifica TaxID=1280941 RepID=UPI000DBF8AA4|nr:ribonuclease E/G [Hyphomonas pacifica]RAN38278.1 hypothetical protein HY11_00265 [Hyphomonas pacifica]